MSVILSRIKSIIQPFKLGKTFEENRHDVRYQIKAPACLEIDNDPSKSCLLFLHNISSGGALVSYTWPVSREKEVTLHTKLPFQQKWYGRNNVDFVFRGKVIRSDEKKGQIAIQFERDYRICKSMPE